MASSELYLTEYERERQKKIEENKRLLETLGIFETRSVLDASTLSLDVAKPKRNYIKRARVQLEPRRSERVSIRPQSTSYAESDDSGTESDKPKPKGGIRKINSYFSVRKTMWKPFYGQEIATCHICLVRNRQPKTKCSRCYADFWRGHVCRGCYEANFTGEDIESFDDARDNPNWVCFVCRGICTCKFCRVGSTKRGKRYTKKRPLEEEEALALAQQGLQIKEERDSDDGQGFMPRKRGRGRPPKSRSSDMNGQLLMGSDPGDEDNQFDHPLFEGELEHHYHQLDQLEQLEQLQEQLNQLEQLDQLEQLEMEEHQDRLRQDQLVLNPEMMQDLSQHLHTHSQLQMPQVPLKRGRGRPPKNPLQQQYKRQKYQKHEHQVHKHQMQKQHRQPRHKSQEYSDINDQDHKLDVLVKQEPLLDDSLMGNDPSLMDHMLHDHMLMLPEQPMLHEHILQDIPPLQEHPLHLPIMHNQSIQDMPQDHGAQDQLFRDHHSTFQTFHSNNFIHHPHHNMYSHNTNNNNNNSLLNPTPHDPFLSHPHFGNHHSVHHHNNINIVNSVTNQSLLLDNSSVYPYMFHNYYTYPQSQDLQQQELQQQLQLQAQQQLHEQQQQQQQEELHRQELHRQEVHRQEMQRQRQQEMHRQDEDDLHLRQHMGLHHMSNHQHILNHDYVQDTDPEVVHRPDSHRELLHPSLLQDHHQEDFYHHEDEFDSGYEPSHDTDHDHDTSRDLSHSLDSYHNPNNNSMHDNHSDLSSSLNMDHPTFKQEFQHPELQHREHYSDQR